MTRHARGTTPDKTRVWVRDVVRSGLHTPDGEYAEIRGVIAQDHPHLDPDATAREWIAQARAEWTAEAGQWSDPTDHDRLVTAFTSLRGQGFLVLEACVDHWVVRDALRADPGVAGAAWFTESDVWHAIDEPMLEVNLWHPSTANAAPGDAILTTVVAAFGAAGLEAHFDEGRVEVAARWRRRPGTNG